MRLELRVLKCMKGVAQGVAGAGLALAVGCSTAGDIGRMGVTPVAQSGARLIPIPPPAPPAVPVAAVPAVLETVASVEQVEPEDLRDEAAGRRKRAAQQRALQAQQARYIPSHVYCGRG